MREMFDQNPALKSKTILLGKLPRHKLAALYKIADVALVPSVYEPFGYAAIEAMAAGVPLVATAAGGLAESWTMKRLAFPSRCMARETEFAQWMLRV